MPTIKDILALGPVMPVIVIDDSQHAVPLAEALLEGGLKTIEITLRTPAALDAIRAVAAACPGIERDLTYGMPSTPVGTGTAAASSAMRAHSARFASGSRVRRN